MSIQHCQRMVPEMSKAAIGLHPLIGTYAVDCDDDVNKQLCAQQVCPLFFLALSRLCCGFYPIEIYCTGNSRLPNGEGVPTRKVPAADAT